MAASLLALLSGCGATGELRAIGEAHRQSVTAAAPVVLFLPGTLASKLENSETGEVVWGGHDRLSVDPRTESGLRQLSLPLTPVPSDTAAAPDAIRATDLLRRAATRILGIRFSTPIYDDALAGLAAAGLTESAPLTLPPDGPALVPFPYDWRRSIVDGALDLGRALEARGEDAPKVTLLAHSMGATVALYYLMFGATPLDTGAPLPEVTWAGASKISRAILVAPPLRGSAVAIRNTVNGNRLAGPLVPVYPPSMLATHPSTFELMPREGSVSIHDGAGTPLPGAHLDPVFWAAQGWGLLGEERAQDRAWLARGAGDPEALAAARQADLMARGRAFHRAFDRPVTPPEGLDLVVLAGKGRETPGAVSIAGDGGVSVTHHVNGDEVVAYESATAGLDAAQPNIRIFPVDAVHSRMLSDPEVFELVMRLLAE